MTITNFSTQVPDAHGDDCDATSFVGPTALVVDGAGNGVLEVGENAVVAPTWMNTGFGAVTFTGTASNFTGPAGPTYDIAGRRPAPTALWIPRDVRDLHRLLRASASRRRTRPGDALGRAR